MLLREGADLRARARNGATALSAAAAQGHTSCVRLLLEAGAATPPSDLDRPLHDASRDGHVDCVDLLLRAGASPHAQDKERRTPLFKAAAQGHLRVVALLLAAGAACNTLDAEDCTPLHVAAMGGAEECVAALLRAGADCEVGAAVQATPLRYAALGGRSMAVRILLRAGASPFVVQRRHDRVAPQIARLLDAARFRLRACAALAGTLQRGSLMHRSLAVAWLYDPLLWRVVMRFAAGN